MRECVARALENVEHGRPLPCPPHHPPPTQQLREAAQHVLPPHTLRPRPCMSALLKSSTRPRLPSSCATFSPCQPW